MNSNSLKDKTIKGVGWSAADTFLSQGVSFIIGIILARLLTPSEYGLIGICNIFLIVFSGIVDSGFSNALIRRKEVSNDDYNTMFFTNLVISIVLIIVLFFTAPFIASFFARPELVELIRVMGLILIFQALSMVQNTVLTRNIDFKTKTKASLISAILSGVIGIGMALTGFGVWSLVGQYLARNIFNTVLLWIYNKWYPSFSFSKQSFGYMWGFGWKLMLSGLLNNIWNQLYQVVVGTFYSPDALGQYSRGKDYANILSWNITTIVQRVTYPVLSTVQENKERMISAYRKVIKVTMFVTALCMICMGAVSGPFIYCLIGPQWEEAASYLPLICISMSLLPLHAINLNMLQVQGRSDIFLILEIIKKIIVIGPICLGIFVDIYWMLIGAIVANILSFFLNSYYTGKDMGYTSWMQLKDVAPSYGIAFLVAISVYFIKFLPITYWIIFPIQICIGAIVFFLVCEILQLEEYVEVKSITSKFITRIRNRK